MTRPVPQIVHIGPCHLEIPAKCGGAVERRMWELARAQVRSGRAVQLFSIGPEDRDEWLEGVLISRIRLTVSGPRRTLCFLSKCAARVDAPGAVFHFHSVPEAAWTFRRFNNVRVLMFDFPRFGRGRKTPLFFAYRWCLQQFDLLLPVSEFCKSTAANYWLLDKQMFSVIHNGVNLQQFSPSVSHRAAFRRAQGVHEGIVLAYAGRVNLQKGTDLLLQSFRELKARYPKLRLLVCGPPEQFGRREPTSLTREIIKAGGIYLGAVSEEELTSFYNAADVLVVPTRRDEMFGMVAAEAQACGTAVIASNNGGLPEVISVSSGRLFASGDAGSLTKTIAAVLDEPALLLRLRQNARESVSRFAWERIALDLDAAYRIAAEQGNRLLERVAREER